MDFQYDISEILLSIDKNLEFIAKSLQKLARCVADPGEVSATSCFNHAGEVTFEFSGDEILIGPEDLDD